MFSPVQLPKIRFCTGRFFTGFCARDFKHNFNTFFTARVWRHGIARYLDSVPLRSGVSLPMQHDSDHFLRILSFFPSETFLLGGGNASFRGWGVRGMEWSPLRNKQIALKNGAQNWSVGRLPIAQAVHAQDLMWIFGDFFPPVFPQRKRPQKICQKSPVNFHPEIERMSVGT